MLKITNEKPSHNLFSSQEDIKPILDKDSFIRTIFVVMQEIKFILLKQSMKDFIYSSPENKIKDIVDALKYDIFFIKTQMNETHYL